jgi:nucleosome-remodeling factor subunit BPTF
VVPLVFSCFGSVVSRFYIGCDLCSNWFHGVCVGITEKEAKKLEDFVCPGCRRGQQGGGDRRRSQT